MGRKGEREWIVNVLRKVSLGLGWVSGCLLPTRSTGAHRVDELLHHMISHLRNVGVGWEVIPRMLRIV